MDFYEIKLRWILALCLAFALVFCVVHPVLTAQKPRHLFDLMFTVAHGKCAHWAKNLSDEHKEQQYFYVVCMERTFRETRTALDGTHAEEP